MNAYKELARAILVRMLKDAKIPRLVEQIKEDLMSEWFADLCVLADVDEDYMRNKIEDVF